MVLLLAHVALTVRSLSVDRLPVGVFPLRTPSLYTLFVFCKKPPKIVIFYVGGGGKNQKVKPHFLPCLWVVFLDTDCKINVPVPPHSILLTHPPSLSIFMLLQPKISLLRCPHSLPTPHPKANPHYSPTYPQLALTPKSKSKNHQPNPTLSPVSTPQPL